MLCNAVHIGIMRFSPCNAQQVRNGGRVLQALDICKTHGFQHEPDPLLTLLTATPAMQVTLEGRPPTLTLSQIGCMHLTDVAKLYSVLPQQEHCLSNGLLHTDVPVHIYILFV